MQHCLLILGTAQSLMNKSEVIDLTAYLLLRASDKYSLQDIEQIKPLK